MTPGELRRLARNKEAIAEALASDADRLRAQSAELDGILNPLVPMSQRVWAGPAAQAFEDRVRGYSARLDVQVLRLRKIAGDFDRQAQMERAEAAALDARAVAAEVAAATAASISGLSQQLLSQRGFAQRGFADSGLAP